MYRLLFRSHPDPLFVMDTSGALLAVNAAFEAVVGGPLGEFQGQSYARFVREDTAWVDAQFAAAVGGERRSYDVACLDLQGRPFDVHVTNVPVPDEHGAVVAVLGIARDLSAQREAQAALERSEERFRGLFEGAGAGIAITDLRGRFVVANPAYLSMLGYTIDELRETDFLSLTHPDDREYHDGQVRALLAAEVPSFTVEKRYLTRTGGVVWVRASVSLIRDGSGRPLHITATTEDITSVKVATERLRRSERLQQLAGRLALVGGWAVESDGRVLYWTPEIYRILDLPEGEEPPLDDVVALYPPPHRGRLEAALEACLRDGTPFDLELEVDTLARRRIPVRAIGEAERDVDGRIVRIVGAFQDITELRHATVEARRAADRLELTLQSMTDAFFTVDRDWRFTFVNGRAGQLLQRDPDDLLGRAIWEEFPEAVGSEVHRAYHAAMDGQGTQEVEEFHYPPLGAWFTITAYPSEQGVAVYFQDVTEQRALRVEREKREVTLHRQAALLDEAQDAIIVRDLDHRITFWNASAQRIYGWTSADVVGRSIRALLYEVADDFDTATAEVLANGSWTGNLTQRTRAGEQVVVSGRWSLLRDADGAPEGILAINTDVTDQQRIQQQLLRAQRMESLGTLAGGVAHDLNNVLSPILLAAELLQLDERPPQEAEQLATIVTSATRGADLVAQVLSFARGVEGRRAPVDLVSLFAELRTIVLDTFPKDIAIEVEPPAPAAQLVGDATQIQQVLLNLAINARDAMPSGGRLTVAADVVAVDAQHLAATPHAAPGTYVRIEVDDTGTGMSAEVRDRIFEPFYTTKAHGAGTGLGLSTSAAIIESHGGFVHVSSEVGRGTRFRVYLPCAAADAEDTSPAPEVAGRPRGQGQLILVVDDEAAVRTMTRRTLEAHGYRVIEAGNGAAAIARYVQHQQDVAVVLTDMMMPFMDGPATIHALQDIDPDVTIVGASGLHGNGKVAEAAAAGITRFIPKPYTAGTLLRTLAEALEGAVGHAEGDAD